VLRIAGPDRLSWLHSLLTQHLTSLAPGTWTQALVLSPQGHVEHHLHLADDGEAVLAHVEPGTADALADFLRRMQFMLRVEVTDVSAEWAVVADPRCGSSRARSWRRTTDRSPASVRGRRCGWPPGRRGSGSTPTTARCPTRWAG
jgi:folate-binding Fe-S cluster repair protein YgfZ